MILLLIEDVPNIGSKFDLLDVPQPMVIPLLVQRKAYHWTKSMERRYGTVVNDRREKKKDPNEANEFDQSTPYES